jgi:RNA polymerase sigma-70 factor (ECF subfamily)
MDEMMDNSDPAFESPSASLAEAMAEVSSDLELVNQARGGDEAAFEELFNRHKRRVSLIASRFFRQREQIEEVLQESFTKAYFALPDFSNIQDNSFASWLARIAFNACYDELRRMKRRPESSLTDVSDEESSWLKEHLFATKGSDIESTAISRDLAIKLLSRLSPEDRLVLVMLDAEGMSVSEIARLMKWSSPKVKVRAHRARASLRKALKRFL